jgi:6,7-dimethyl-8-ribityllumazine synthase
MQRKEYKKVRAVGNASTLRVALVVSRFNSDITESMLEAALMTLREWGVTERNTHVVHVPGSFEIPVACQKVIKKVKPHAIVALGCVIQGDTKHDHYISSAVSHGIMRLSLDHTIPISFGILTTNNLAQAKVRSQGKANKGHEAALAVLETALL